MNGRVLIVAGSDSGGGAGIQADIKSVTALGGYAATAITALTAQDTTGVHGVHPVPIDFLQQQMRLVLADIGADAIKTGMLHSAEVIEAVVDVLENEGAGIPVVVDPVMMAKGGAPLLEPDAMETLKRRMVPAATVLTPNAPEAEAITGLPVRRREDMDAAAQALLDLGAKAVFLKGGHLDGDDLTDLLATPDGAVAVTSKRIDTAHTHGTGCTLASAIAAGVAQGLSLEQACRRGQAYVHQAILGAPGYGQGHGPVDHGHTVAPFDGS